MKHFRCMVGIIPFAFALPAAILVFNLDRGNDPMRAQPEDSTVTVHQTVRHDTSQPLAAQQSRLIEAIANVREESAERGSVEEVPAGTLAADSDAPSSDEALQGRGVPPTPPVMTAPPGSAAVEQTAQGAKPGPELVESFDGLGMGFSGPQGTAVVRNPSDNSLAVGPNHIAQIVNSRMAIYTKKGKLYDSTGKVLYGPVPTNTIFKGFGGACENRLSGDAVVRYDQLADRWLFVLPVFQRGAARPDQKAPGRAGEPAQESQPGQPGQPGQAARLFVPPPPPPPDPNAPPAQPGQRGRAGAPGQPGQPTGPQGPYSMCYAVSTSSDPMGSYYRYEFLRPLFPDYPRPAVWPDGYYVPTSTGDNRISETITTQKHACVADRVKMLKGEPATEHCVIIENVNFLNNADVDGKNLPPAGSPNIMMAAGGRQLDKIMEDNVIDVWQFHVDWKDPSKTRVTGPDKITVAPYHYLCDGQLTFCVPQPGSERRLDAQGDKIMARLAYRRVSGHESIIAVHSVNTAAGGGGVRWYEFRIDKGRKVSLFQQGTYAPEGFYRWMASPAMDKFGNIGIGYSFGGPPHFAGQRFAGRLANDPPGQLTLHETILANGEGPEGGPSQGRPMAQRWEDYTQTAVDPSDDCTIWYVGDYVKKDAPSYSSKIGAFRMPGCRK